MKKIFRSIYLVLKAIGYSRTAAELARNGKHKEAQDLMIEYSKCK